MGIESKISYWNREICINFQFTESAKNLKENNRSVATFSELLSFINDLALCLMSIKSVQKALQIAGLFNDSFEIPLYSTLFALFTFGCR